MHVNDNKMSKNNRGAFFALGLISGAALALLFLVWAIPEFRSAPFAERYYENWYAAAQTSQNGKPDDSHFWIRELYGWVYAEDTLAQWLMALLGFAATAISLYALIWLRRTWDQTKRSADAAWAAIDEARRIGEAQVRAYIGSPRVEARLETERGIQCFRIEAFLSNSGNSPALLPSVTCFVTQGDTMLNMRHTRLERDIAAGENDFRFLRQGHPVSMQPDRSDLIFEGAIRYHTVFGGPHKTTNFRLRLSRIQEGDGPLDVRFDERLGDGEASAHHRD